MSPKRDSGTRPGSASTKASSMRRWRLVERPMPRTTRRLSRTMAPVADASGRRPPARRRAKRRHPSGSRPASARQPAGILPGVRRLRALPLDSPHRRRRPPASGERFQLDERDFSGVYEFTDLIDRFLPPAGLVMYDDLERSAKREAVSHAADIAERQCNRSA